MLEMVDTQPPEGFWYKMEVEHEINDTDKMHGSQARSILSFAVFGAYLVGNKQYFDPFLPRLLRWCQTAIELKIAVGNHRFGSRVSQ